MLELFKELFTGEEILKGNFGIEREALRVNENGELSTKCHPKVFGNKIKNPYITVDFAESQVEMITPTLQSIKDVHEFLDSLYDYVALNIDGEYLWPQSMPSIIDEALIKVADFDSSGIGKDAKMYRNQLVEKYGCKKQLISGIHYNFSFDESIIKKLYEKTSAENYKTFKDNFYLKVVRNYLRYRWVTIYLLGASPIVHKTYDEKYLLNMEKWGSEEYSNKDAVSFRNSEAGYENIIDIYPDYKSVSGHVNSINEYVNKGILYNYKELYSQIRLKAKDNFNLLDSLINDGINYLEIRNIDINPFEKAGVSYGDLEFLHLFFIYLSIKEEADYEFWQHDALFNQRAVAGSGLSDIFLKKDGVLIKKEAFLKDIISEIKIINEELNLKKDDTINMILKKVENKELTYAYKMKNQIEIDGYVNFNMLQAKNYVDEVLNKYNIKKVNNNCVYYTEKNILVNSI